MCEEEHVVMRRGTGVLDRTLTGTVVHINRARRCGTVCTEEGRSVFFSERAVASGMGTMTEGTSVSLVCRMGPLGLVALKVEAIHEAAG